MSITLFFILQQSGDLAHSASCQEKFLKRKGTLVCESGGDSCRRERESLSLDWLMAVDHTAQTSEDIVSESDVLQNIGRCQVCFK